ncbi:putative myosin-2 essential light chain-like [Apostichopus japonicus]|uniref:Putative myosin-2 essential light chain-like n=1 Tax=Stichopus japonicus TaxID=307972 RepID=A0A2G8KFJ4_STIJA|nr:putative myosin-2 essential light chain-like [Apostichopus japonicus]
MSLSPRFPLLLLEVALVAFSGHTLQLVSGPSLLHCLLQKLLPHFKLVGQKDLNKNPFKMSKQKKSGAPRELAPEEIEEYRENFLLFDTKGDNKVQGISLVTLSGPWDSTQQRLCKECSRRKLDEFVRVSWEEFFPMLETCRIAKREGKEGTEDDFFECFKVFDKEDNGQVNAGEMTHVLCTLAERLREDELEPLISKHIDPHGNLKYEGWGLGRGMAED